MTTVANEARPSAPSRLLYDKVIGNVASADVADRLRTKRPDALPITWLDCTRRAFRARTAAGREVAVLLPLGVTLAHGDILFEDDQTYVVVETAACDLWRVPAATTPPCALARVALELGNLHVPVEVTPDGDLLTPPDGPAARVFREAGVRPEECRRRFAPLRATVTSGVSVAKGLKVVARGGR